jgi:TatD DNase family protein
MMKAEYGIIDSHIHFDLYKQREQELILSELNRNHIIALITVSFHLKSCQENFRLSQMDDRVRPAFGYHPEQPLPTEQELAGIMAFMNENKAEMLAVGEVGLPYYLRKENPAIDAAPYEELLKIFVQQAKELNKPIILHAIYEDADTAIRMLEQAEVCQAHFHWFKGSSRTLSRMKSNGYYISVTPDLLYEDEIKEIVNQYPLELLLVETDGPWRFEEPFNGEMTHPRMIHKTVEAIAEIKKESPLDVYKIILENTKKLYSL